MTTEKNRLSPAERKRMLDLEILSCKDATGRIVPSALWRKGEADKDCLLHEEFNWNEREAAEESWTRHAEQLIRSVKIEVTIEERSFKVPKYISDQSTKESAYVETETVKEKAEVVRIASLQAELVRVKGAIQRAMAVAVYFNLESRFEVLMQECMAIEEIISGMEDKAA